MAHEDSRSAILSAMQSGDLPSVTTLLEQDPHLVHAADEHGKTALHWAAERDDLELARAAIDAGGDIEALTSWGASPLDWAATMGSRRVAELLVTRGATGLTLVVAAGLGQLDRVRDTLEGNDDLSAHRRRGAPSQPNADWPAESAHIQGDVISDAVYAAARNGHTAVVEYLLGRGAAADAKGIFGATALHWAAINGHQSTIDVLLAHGASLGVRDRRFDATPAEWAMEGGHQELAARLRRR